MHTLHRIVLSLTFLLSATAGCSQADIPEPVAVTPTLPTPPATSKPESQLAAPTAAVLDIPYELISQESLLQYLEGLTSIQPYSGWRNSASSGEAEALDFVEEKLGELSSLTSRGLELERQEFPVYLSTEIHDSRLTLTVNGQPVEVPADGLRGSRQNRQMAVYMDSDGLTGDSDADPVSVQGRPLIVRDGESLYSIAKDELKDRVLFLDYSMLDYFISDEGFDNGSQLIKLVDDGAAGVVLVTQYSNQRGVSRGTGVGDGSAFLYGVPTRRVPVLYVRLEDLSVAGIRKWEDLEKIETAQLELDADVFSPGKAGNLIARIPGADSSKAVILGAHIDSPNGPGAFDDGSGSAALLEVARVLDESQVQPVVDIYLAWFGGHEIGTYGSSHFAATHQELLDRTLGLIQMDGLGYPLEDRPSKITMLLTSYGLFGDERLLLPDFLSQAASAEGIDLDQMVEYGLIADNSNFDAFNVPNVYLGYMNAQEMRTKGSSYIHYSNHWHDPYDTVELAGEVGKPFVEMTKVMLAAAMEIGITQPDLRIASPTPQRALFAANHTEATSLPTSMLRELGMALSWEGFDVDLIPYGQSLVPADFDDVGIVVLPPIIDYPGQHNERWEDGELALLERYVAQGGLLVVVNSACSFLFKRCVDEMNEDTRSLNDFLEAMGVKFTYGSLSGDIVRPVGEHPLTTNAPYLTFYSDNGIPFKMDAGLALFEVNTHPIVGLVAYGDKSGEILVIGDLGLLQTDRGAKNIEFIKNIAHYAMSR